MRSRASPRTTSSAQQRSIQCLPSDTGALMLFEQVPTGGCQSYLIGCADSCAAALIDPEISQVDRYQALAARHGLRFHYVIDTHTHADHFSATQQIGRTLGVP